MKEGILKNTIRNNFERLIVAFITSLIIGSALFVGLRAVHIPLWLSVILSLFGIMSGIVWLPGKLPNELTGIRKRKPWLSITWFVIALVGLVQITRLSFFMLYPAQTNYSLFPWDKWLVEHCCLTAYNEAARMSMEGAENIYNTQKYLDRQIAGFNVDAYHYPPPFLLLPVAARTVVGNDFLDLRRLWFAMGVILLMSAIGSIIYHLEIEGKMRIIGMAPLIWCSLPVLSGLQMSNVQIIVISISIIAMVLIPTQKGAGALLLAMSTVAKIFPGILFVYLLVTKKYKSAILVIVFAAILSLLTLLIVGSVPFQAFINYELPRLSSGEAFSRPFSRIFAVSRNMAPFGIPLKLEWLGIQGMTLEVGRIFSTVYLVMIIGLTIWSARRKTHSNMEKISIWISLISLGSLVSPFAPSNYVLVSVIILVCVNRELFRPSVAIVIWLTICIPFFISRQAPFLIQVICFIPAQIIAIGLPGLVLYRAGKVRLENKEILPGSTAEVLANYD